MTPRVVVAEASARYNLSAAESYGEIVYLSDRVINPFDTGAMISLYRSRMECMEFDPKSDFICATGYALKIACLLAVAARRHGDVKVLMFHAATSSYRERIMAFGEVLHEQR